MGIFIGISEKGTIEIKEGEEKYQHKSRSKGRNIIDFPDTYCIIDTETTGLSPEYDSIIEISAIKYNNGNVVSQFSSLVKPDITYEDGTYIDDFITELTGITNEMLAEAPSSKSVIADFKEFIGDDILIGHNVNFDINFLYDCLEKNLSSILSNNYIDTMRISRRLHPEERHHRLSDLAQRYHIDYSHAHRSLSDCYITQFCYSLLKQEIINKYGTIDDFLSSCKKKQLKSSDITSNKEIYNIFHPLFGKVCVFTGVLEKMPRKEAMQIVADLGGINGDNVTKKTNYLILGNNDYCSLIKDGKSSKQKKAEKLKLEGHDIEIIPESVFYEMIFD